MANGLCRGLIADALVGAAATLLVAPNKGNVNRNFVWGKGTGYVNGLRQEVRRDRDSGTS